MRRFAHVVALPDPKMVISFSRMNTFTPAGLEEYGVRGDGGKRYHDVKPLLQRESQKRPFVRDSIELSIIYFGDTDKTLNSFRAINYLPAFSRIG